MKFQFLRGPIQKRTRTSLINLSTIVFTAKAIRQRALDCLNEWKRRVHKDIEKKGIHYVRSV